MGVFDLAIGCMHGAVHTRRVNNVLMWRSQARLLRRVMPPQSGGPFSFEIGFSGPTLKGWTETVTPTDAPPVGYTLDRRGKASDFVGDWGNEGCSPAADMREVIGYARQAVTWTAQDDPSGVRFSTGWHTWTNRLEWIPRGDYTPEDWDVSLYGNFPPPWGWDCYPWEVAHMYPWVAPIILPAWWRNTVPPAGHSHPDNQNIYDLDCETCAGMSAHQFGGYRNATVFLLIKGGGYEDEAFAAAQFKAPVSWRWGGLISAQYTGRFGN